MFKRIAISLGIVSVAVLVVYTIKVHQDNRDLIGAAEDMIELFTQHDTDIEFANIIEGLGDIDNG